MSVPVLFLHGWAMRGAMFDDVAARLGAGYDCHAPDLPGHGSRAGEEPSLETCAALVRQMARQMDRPVLVGWSMGAAAAWRYLRQDGTSGVRGLVTIDMSPRMLPAPGWTLGMTGQTAEAILATSARIEPEWPRIAGSIARNMFARNSTPALSRSEVENLLRTQDPARLRPLWDDLVAMDERGTIAGINVPYLVCSGAQSRLYGRETADWIASNAPNARVEHFANSGHSPHLEEPDAFCDALRRFFAAEGLATAIQDQDVTR